MKIIKFEHDNEVKHGFLSDDNQIVYAEKPQRSSSVFSQVNNIGIKVQDVKMLTPERPSKIVCVGRNYAEHAAELGNEVPKEPLLFLKAPSSLISEYDFIEIPAQSAQVEHEGELGIVIGNTCKDIHADEDLSRYILGYICLNDVTARDLQKKDVQFTRAKSFDTFCPVSKYIQTNLDVSDLLVTTKVNGAIKQSGRTSQMIFSVPFIMRYISKQMTLNFGDIIATGTPSGVSALNSGDICEVEIEGIGKLSNPVR